MSTGALLPNSSVSASPPPEKPPVTSPPPPMASPPSISPPSPANSSLSPPPPQPSTPPPTNSSPPPPPPQSDPPSPPPPTPKSQPQPPPPSSPPPKSQPQPPPPSSPPPNSQTPPPPENLPPPPRPSPSPPSNDPPPSPPSNNAPPPQSPPSPPTNDPPLAPSTALPPPSPPLSPPPNSPVIPSDPIPPPPQGSSSPPVINASPPPPLVVSPPSHTNTSTTTPSLSLTPPNRANISPEKSQPGSDGGNGTGTAIGITVAIVLILLGILGTVACCLWKRKKKAPGRSGSLVLPAVVVSSSDMESESRKVQITASYNRSNSSNGNMAYTPRTPGGGLMNSRSWFTYEELLKATNGFSDSNLLGEGGFGSVYKGVLSDGKEVAVKQLKIGGSQGEREFRAEVDIISRIHHRHLVSLVGYCIYDDGRILVYEYVPNNNLYFHLHGEGRPVLNWATRVKIAIGSARGLAYLHEDCHPRVIHRDIKTSNILLDNNFEARVSDFGLAKLAMDANTHVSTRVVGTFGYMAPEYASSGKLTEKSDVFSFGVVLLELITGRKPLDTSEPLGDESLVEWARPLLNDALESHEFKSLADPRLDGNYDEGEMFRMIEAAAACVRHSSSKRPTMGQVVRAFDTMSTSDLTNGMRLGESDVYDCAPSTHLRVFQKMVNRNGDFTMDSFFQDSYSSEEHPVNSTQRQ